jgi:multiple sugar transport system permease protein
MSAPQRTPGGTIAGRRRTGQTRRTGFVHTLIGVAILAVLLFPLYWMLNTSLQPHQTGGVRTPWFPIHPSVHGYVQAIHDQGGHFLTSLIIALGCVCFSLLIAAPAAYALAQFNVKGVGVVLLMILISQMIPGIVVANALYRFYSDLGLLNSIPGLILADSALAIPFAILILRAFMLTPLVLCAPSSQSSSLLAETRSSPPLCSASYSRGETSCLPSRLRRETACGPSP